MNKQLVLKRSVLAVAFTLGTTSLVMAQQANASQPIQKVIVTGSNIKRAVDTETSSPVQVLTAADIKTIGASTVKDVLDTLTGNTGALSDLGGGNSFASGATGVSLRNLGKNSTLTLLNGRRVANYGLADGGQETFVNIDALPSDVIERVEILLDGASAVYGSDAVAGVINIITKKDFQGGLAKVSARNSLLKSALNKDQTASLTLGAGDYNNDGWNLFGHIEAFHRSPYADREIESAVSSWYKEYVNPSFGVTSTYSYPGNYVDRYPTVYPTNPALAGKTFSTPVAGCAVITAGTCRFDQYDRLGINAEAQRYNFFGSGRLKLSGNRSAFAELTLGHTTTTYYNPPPIMQYTGTPSRWYDAKNKRLNFFTEPKLAVGHPNNPYSFPVSLRYRYADDVEIFKSAATAKQYRLMAGLEGADYGWDWNTAIGVMGSKVHNGIRGAKHAKNYLAAVTSGEYKFGGVNSPDLMLRMFPELVFAGESKQVFVDAKASRELMQLAGGAMALAVGGDFRTDSFSAYVSDNIANAEIVGYGSINVNGKRNISALFAELNAPVTKKLELNGAVRLDKVGNTDVSAVPKLSAKYAVNNSLVIRGTVAHGFRAPNVAETGEVALSAFNNSIVDPKRCAAANQIYAALRTGTALDLADSLRARDLGCGVSFASSVQGNPELAPEKARSLNLGLVFEPIRNLSMTLDYYHIERRNEIGTLSSTLVLAQEDALPGSVQRLAVTEDDKRLAARASELSGKALAYPVGPITALYRQYLNLNRTRVSGLDMEIKHNVNLGSAGKLKSSLKANYQLDYRGWDTIENTYTENLAGNYRNYKYNVRANTSWSRGPLTLGATATYIPETRLYDDKYDTNYLAAGCEDQDIPADYCRLEKDALLDVYGSYEVAKNFTAYLNIYNITNSEPRVDVRAGNPPLRGRTAKVSLEYRF